MAEVGPSRSRAIAENGSANNQTAGTSTSRVGHHESNTAGDSDEHDDASSNDGDEGEQEEVMTLAEVVKAVEEAWQNEKWTADLLVPVTLEVEHMVAQIKIMERNLARGCKSTIKLVLHTMELYRLKFMVTSYYRTRLYKIEEFCWYINAKEEERKKLAQEYREKKTTRRPPPSRLMPNEQKFLAEYLHITEGHLKNVALQGLPAPLQKLDRSKFIKEPHLDAFVFFVANENHDVYEPDQQIYVQLQTGIKYMMRYRLVANLLEAGAITLV